MKELAQIISPIATELAQFEAFFEKTLHADTEPMNSIMRYVGDTRGKRLRPVLVLLCAKLFGQVNERTVRAATFVELVHSATLLHDDVVDDADERRGRSSVKAQFGNLSAVLAGDFLLAKAMLLLSEPGDHAILQEMLRTTAAMSEGELMQDASVTTDAYLDIITRKTAMLMRSCCAAGALSVNATSEQVQQIANFGINFGILFQLRDDLLDGENLEQAQALLPIYHDKALQALGGFPPSEIIEALRDLTAFCAERME
ncbi:MAG: polyprenyl synthetase family protein [Bacteroidales bacterium]|nr:polyprenyl synthetase family protein [Bacteroidales bacterium]